MQFSVRPGPSGWASVARVGWRSFLLATLAGVAVLLFSGTASAETCSTGCEDSSDTASPTLLGSSLHTVNGLVRQPVDQLLGRGGSADEPTSSHAAVPATAQANAAAAPDADTPATDTPAADTSSLAQAAQAASAASVPTLPTSSAPSPAITEPSGLAEPLVGAVTDSVATVVPAADTAEDTVATPVRDLLGGQSLQGAVETTTNALADLGAAAVPAVVATVRTLDTGTRQLLDTARATTTAVLDSTKQVVATATGTLQPVTSSVTSVLAATLAGPAGSAPSAPQADSGAGVPQLTGATLGEGLPILGVAFPSPWTDLVPRPASADPQVPTPPPDQPAGEASATEADHSTLVLSSHQAPVPAASSAAAAPGGGTAGPSATELGKVFFDVVPAAPQPGFVPALHHSAYVPSAPVVEPAQSPD